MWRGMLSRRFQKQLFALMPCGQLGIDKFLGDGFSFIGAYPRQRGRAPIRTPPRDHDRHDRIGLHCSDAWFECQRARVVACGHAVLLRSDRSCGLRRSDGGYGSVRDCGTPRRDHGSSFDSRLRPVGGGSLGDWNCTRPWGRSPVCRWLVSGLYRAGGRDLNGPHRALVVAICSAWADQVSGAAATRRSVYSLATTGDRFWRQSGHWQS